MKSAHFSNNIIAIILLAVSVVISVANLVFIVSGGEYYWKNELISLIDTMRISADALWSIVVCRQNRI
jgi:hypothetical protein